MALQEFLEWGCDRCALSVLADRKQPPDGWHNLVMDGLDPEGVSLDIKMHLCPSCSAMIATGLRQMKAKAGQPPPAPPPAAPKPKSPAPPAKKK